MKKPPPLLGQAAKVCKPHKVAGLEAGTARRAAPWIPQKLRVRIISPPVMRGKSDKCPPLLDLAAIRQTQFVVDATDLHVLAHSLFLDRLGDVDEFVLHTPAAEHLRRRPATDTNATKPNVLAETTAL
eukprot:1250853-Pleurochrysis_carterae.AAC.4